MAVSALSAGVINRNTSLFDPGWWQLPGSEKRYRDWKKWGHGHLNVTKSLEESADTFFYQVAYDMGIDRLSEWMSKFGYGHYTGVDLAEERSGNMPTREWKLKRFKKPWYQGDTIPVGIGQGYWTATPLQMNKAMMILINDGVVKVPHLLQSTVEEGKKVPWAPAAGSAGGRHSFRLLGDRERRDVRRGKPPERYRAQILSPVRRIKWPRNPVLHRSLA